MGAEWGERREIRTSPLPPFLSGTRLPFTRNMSYQPRLYFPSITVRFQISQMLFKSLCMQRKTHLHMDTGCYSHYEGESILKSPRTICHRNAKKRIQKQNV